MRELIEMAKVILSLRFFLIAMKHILNWLGELLAGWAFFSFLLTLGLWFFTDYVWMTCVWTGVVVFGICAGCIFLSPILLLWPNSNYYINFAGKLEIARLLTGIMDEAFDETYWEGKGTSKLNKGRTKSEISIIAKAIQGSPAIIRDEESEMSIEDIYKKHDIHNLTEKNFEKKLGVPWPLPPPLPKTK